MISEKQVRFQKIHIEISNICNLECSFCPKVIRSKKMMDLSLFEKLIEEAAPLTQDVCFHLMGDPLVHPNLKNFVELTHKYGVRIFLVTNGVLMRPDKEELLLHPAFRQVNFSLHSFFDNYPERDPGEYLGKIFKFTRRALRDRPELYVNYRLWNLQDVRGASRDNHRMLDAIVQEFKLEESWKQSVLKTNIKNQKSFPIQGRLYLHLDTEFTWPSPDLPIHGDRGTCYGLRTHFGVLVDGTVVPCCLDKEGRIPLGKFPDQKLSEILNAPRAQKILKGFQSGRLVEDLCQRCQYIQRFNGY
jgi:MoaA/NifB/PqqE/SkfB family radical SAM enzyme